MFRKKTSSISSIPDRESVTASLRPSVESSRSPRSPPTSQRRQPETGVGLARLLETYDEFPNVVSELETRTEQLRLAEEQAQEAEVQRADADQKLITEKEEREAEVKQAKKDLAAAETAREKKIRGELEPKIKTLETNNTVLTTERDKLKKEIADLRLQSQKWISGIEALHKERLLIEERENKAAEERKAVDEKRKALEITILSGLKEASTVPEEPAAVDGETTKATTGAATTTTGTKTAEEKTIAEKVIAEKPSTTSTNHEAFKTSSTKAASTKAASTKAASTKAAA